MARWLALLVAVGIGMVCAGSVCAQDDRGAVASDRDEKEASNKTVDDNPFGDPKAKKPRANENPFGAPEPAKESAANHRFDAPPRDQKRSNRGEKRKGGQRDEPRRMRTADKLRNELESSTTMDFIDAPLQDVVEYLKDFHDIEMQLDLRALEERGVGADTPITARLKSLSLRDALRYLLDQYELDYVVQDSMLLITTRDAADQIREVRVYNVAECVGPTVTSHELANAIKDLFGPRAAPTSKVTNGHGLVHDVSGFVVPLGEVLIVRASQREHEEIEKLLCALGKSLAHGE